MTYDITTFRVDALAFPTHRDARMAANAWAQDHIYAAFQYREYRNEGWFAALVSQGKIVGWLKAT
jgi:hypothetical protein